MHSPKPISAACLGKALGLAALTVLASTTARAEGYIGLKEGVFSDSLIGGANSDLSWEKNKGRMREAEFAWGDQGSVRIMGGIGVDSENSASNYTLGLILPSDAQFVVRQFSMKDRIVFGGDTFWGIPQHSLGDVNATTTEISYVKPAGSDMEYMFTYGKSDMPMQIAVNEAKFAGGQQGLVIDMKPDLEYLTAGFRNPGMKSKVKNGNIGWNGYGAYEIGFGLMRQKTSQQVYDVSYGNSAKGNAEVTKLGIRDQTGWDATMRMHLEGGALYLFDVYGKRGAFSLGAFWNYTLPWASGLFPTNETSTGYAWGLGARMVYGAAAGVAFAF